MFRNLSHFWLIFLNKLIYKAKFFGSKFIFLVICGYQIGGAKVSEKHANFIVNTGNASAQDVYRIIKLIQDKVLAETGYVLETEIGFVGEF